MLASELEKNSDSFSPPPDTRGVHHTLPAVSVIFGSQIERTSQCVIFGSQVTGNAPGYLADDCQLVADARFRQLRSADTRTLVVSRTRSSFGDRTFAAAGPQVYNSLLPYLRLCGLSYGQFIRLLKTFLFSSEATAQCEVFLTAPNRNILTTHYQLASNFRCYCKQWMDWHRYAGWKFIFLGFYMPSPGHTGRRKHNILNPSVCLSVTKLVDTIF